MRGHEIPHPFWPDRPIAPASRYRGRPGAQENPTHKAPGGPPGGRLTLRSMIEARALPRSGRAAVPPLRRREIDLATRSFPAGVVALRRNWMLGGAGPVIGPTGADRAMVGPALTGGIAAAVRYPGSAKAVSLVVLFASTRRLMGAVVEGRIAGREVF